MKCRNCAREFVGNFCPDCGTPASGQSANYEQAQNQQYQPNPTIIINNTNTNAFGHMTISPKSRWVAFILCFFVGLLGVHRFYVGKVGTGILYLFTGGLFGIGALVDGIMILCGSFRDCYGAYLKR